MLTERAVPPLRSAVLVTFAALVMYRLGQTVPLPGLSPGAVADVIGDATSAIPRLSIMTLGLTPLLSVLLLVELLRYLVPPFARWYDARRQRLRWWIVALALAMAMVQAVGMANALEHITHLVSEPGLTFRILIVVSLLAGVAALIWLADEVTRRGLTDGFWLLLCVPVVAELPRTFAYLKQLAAQGAILPQAIWLMVAYLLVGAVIVVALATARHEAAGDTPIAGLWPPILATTVAGWLSALGLIVLKPSPEAYQAAWYGPQGAGYIIAVAMLVIAFSMLRLLRAAGERTADRAALVRAGAITGAGQAVVCTLGSIVAQVNPLAVAGMWLIVVVTVAVRIQDRLRRPAT